MSKREPNEFVKLSKKIYDENKANGMSYTQALYKGNILNHFNLKATFIQVSKTADETGGANRAKADL